MGRLRWALLLLIAATTIHRTALAQQPIHWEATIDSAKKAAAQSNRLVLVFFMGGFCRPCHEMEDSLRNQPGAPAAIEANFVPVKINTEFYPNTAKQYGVTMLPTTIVLAPTPQGEVLAVIPQKWPVDQYLTRLNQVASDVKRRNAGAFAQIPANPAVGTLATAAPRPAGPPATLPTGGTATLPAAPSANPFTLPPSNVAPPASPLPTGNAVASAMGPRIPTGPAADSRLAPAKAASAVASLAKAPLGLDGFCPVQLIDHARWRPGNKSWGIIHRGRTYLFAGPDELRKFSADPDRYAPASSGNDVVVALEQGRAVAGRRDHGVQFKGHVYLFVDEGSLEKFRSNPHYYAERAMQAIAAPPQTAAMR